MAVLETFSNTASQMLPLSVTYLRPSGRPYEANWFMAEGAVSRTVAVTSLISPYPGKTSPSYGIAESRSAPDLLTRYLTSTLLILGFLSANRWDIVESRHAPYSLASMTFAGPERRPGPATSDDVVSWSQGLELAAQLRRRWHQEREEEVASSFRAERTRLDEEERLVLGE